MEAPNLNTGKPWSPQEIADLKFATDRGDSVEEIADFLCRTRAEVRKQVASLRRAAKLEEADAPRWRDAKPCFVRYGPLPPGGRSRNFTTGLLEAGVSVSTGRFCLRARRALWRGAIDSSCTC